MMLCTNNIGGDSTTLKDVLGDNYSSVRAMFRDFYFPNDEVSPILRSIESHSAATTEDAEPTEPESGDGSTEGTETTVIPVLSRQLQIIYGSTYDGFGSLKPCRGIN